jgi:outer membrane protein OmpA-like peptidoglycan-associated protein
MQMLKFFTVSFALLSLVFSGCGSKSQEPQVVEDIKKVDEEQELDLEHVKKIEEEERKQEEKAAEFLVQEAALKAAETEAAAETAAQVKLLAQTEATETDVGPAKTAQFETLEITEDLSQETSTQEVNPDSSSDDAQIVAQQESLAVSSTEPELSAEHSTSSAQETVKMAIIVAPEPDDKPAMYIPVSRLALLSALKLVSCKNIPVKMEDIHQRLLNTKDINIVDRSLRDVNNDRLMPVVHFDFDQITIKPDYLKLLQQQSSCVMKALKARGDMIVQIEGHADERGSDEYNLALGHRRANAIANSIMAYLPNSALARIISYGEEFPLDNSSGKSDWDKNRRVEFTLLLKP